MARSARELFEVAMKLILLQCRRRNRDSDTSSKISQISLLFR